jgi:hypothetical protein
MPLSHADSAAGSLPHLIRDSADAVSRLIDQFLRAKAEDEQEQESVNITNLLWLTVRDIWRQFQHRLDQGLEAGKARQAAACASLACDSLLRVIARFEAGLAPGASREVVEGLSGLIAAASEIRAIQKAARQLVDMLNAPAPPIDEDRLAEGVAAVGRGDFENTEAIIKRLKAGEDL